VTPWSVLELGSFAVKLYQRRCKREGSFLPGKASNADAQVEILAAVRTWDATASHALTTYRRAAIRERSHPWG